MLYLRHVTYFGFVCLFYDEEDTSLVKTAKKKKIIFSACRDAVLNYYLYKKLIGTPKRVQSFCSLMDRHYKSKDKIFLGGTGLSLRLQSNNLTQSNPKHGPLATHAESIARYRSKGSLQAAFGAGCMFNTICSESSRCSKFRYSTSFSVWIVSGIYL